MTEPSSPAVPVPSAPRTAGARQVARALLFGGIPDHLNRNLAIRDAIAEAFRERLGPESVRVSSLFEAEDRLDDTGGGFVLILGSAMADESDYHALAHEARRRGLPVVVWLTDDPYEFDVNYKFTDLADLIFTNDRWTRTYYRRAGVFHLPLAASKSRHYREILTNDADYSFDIFFCGVGFENRRKIIDGLRPVLSKHRTLVCGAEWKENAPYIQNRRIAADEFIDHCHRSRIVLNLARDYSYANDQFQITPSTPGPRTFEAAMAGCVQMVFADRPEIMDYYALDQEIVLFSGLADFAAKVERLLADPASRVAIARAAQGRTIAEHQYVHRIDRILEQVRSLPAPAV